MLSKLSEASFCKLFGGWGWPWMRLSVSTTRSTTCGRSVTTRRVGRRNSGLLAPASGRRRRDLTELCRKQMHNFHHGHRSVDACASNQLQKGHSRCIHEVACPALCTRQSDSFQPRDSTSPLRQLLARWAFSSMLLKISHPNEEEWHTRGWRRRSDRRRG